jgi:hypothetical protein
MTRFVLLVFAATLQAVSVAHAGEITARREKPPTSMRFEWHSELPRGRCQESCRRWISAVGPITDETPNDFQTFANADTVRGATLVLDSGGGSVAATLELGRTIRRLGIKTTVGRTVPSGAGVATVSPDASCSSMCVFLLLAGVKRSVSATAQVNVHQIWITKKRNRMQANSYDAEDIARIQTDIGKLARYTAEMDGSAELLEIALRVPAWGPLHRLSMDELRRVRLNIADNIFDGEIAPAVSAKAASPVARALGASAVDGNGTRSN